MKKYCVRLSTYLWQWTDKQDETIPLDVYSCCPRNRKKIARKMFIIKFHWQFSNVTSKWKAIKRPVWNFEISNKSSGHVAEFPLKPVVKNKKRHELWMKFLYDPGKIPHEKCYMCKKVVILEQNTNKFSAIKSVLFLKKKKKKKLREGKKFSISGKILVFFLRYQN